MLLKSIDSISSHERYCRIISQFYRCSLRPVVKNVTLCQDVNRETCCGRTRSGSEGTPKLGPYWKLQPVACKVNIELRSELSL